MGASDSTLVSSQITRFTSAGETDRIKYAVSSSQGRSNRMEDAYAAVPDLDGTMDASFFGVYDGHGGSQVALYCSRVFHKELKEQEDYQNSPVDAMERVFFRMDQLIEQSDEWKVYANPGCCVPCLKNGVWPFNEWPLNMEEYASEGCTACTVLVKDNQVIVGNVGDCHCIVSRNGETICLTTNHWPSDSNESNRIRKAGGCLIKEFWRDYGRLRNPNHREGGLVALNNHLYVSLPFSRSIGDSIFKQNKNLPPQGQMVTCAPDLETVDITLDTEFFVIGSYGLWKCLCHDRVARIVRQHLREGVRDLRDITEAILDDCLRSVQSRENVTVILVQFKTFAQNHSQPTGDSPGTTEDEVPNPCVQGTTEDGGKWLLAV